MTSPLAPLLLALAGCAAPAPLAPDSTLLADQLRADLAAALAVRGLPGATLSVVLPDGTAVDVAAGVADPERDPRPLTPSDRMLAGSTGKTFFAACALALAADGAIDLDERLALRLGAEPWFAELPNADRVTLRQLLTHTSGVPEHVWDPAVVEAVQADPDRVWGHAEIARLVAGREPLAPPGTSFAYADANYVLAMLAVERAAGEDLHALARRRFLAPLGLDATTPSDRRDLPGLVQGHAVLGARLGAPPRVVGDDGRLAVQSQFEWAGGGYVSTSADLARWARALWSGALLDAPYLDDVLATVPTPDGPGDAYGIATIVRATELGPAHGHDGFFPGYLTSIAWFPEHGVSAAVQVNTDDVRAVGGALFDALLLPAARRAAAYSNDAPLDR